MTDNVLTESVIKDYFNNSDYKIIQKIGQGGFGQVYKAIQTKTQQNVAIKILTLSSEFDIEKKTRYVARFERESLLGAKLQHPNIVRLLDKGKFNHELVFATYEFIEGETLKERLQKKGILHPVEAAEIMTQVLDALAHAHQQGIIHRDIKPANIMLTEIGTRTHVKILDFGIGSFISELRPIDHKTITLTHETLGTPSYSAPEQLRGEPPTQGTDLYSWGLVFIECLTGIPAISGATLASIFHKQLHSVNIPIPTSIAGHPIAALLQRTLQKKVSERISNAKQLYNDLIKLNMSSLVGNLTNYSSKKNPSANVSEFNKNAPDETLVAHNNFFYTGFTERKQITALSLIINAKISHQTVIDYEVVDALIRDQKSQCIDVAIRYGGLHVGSLGNSALIYFGYPIASDNDSRLCARTALDMMGGINKRNTLLNNTQGIQFFLQIGIHTGPMTSYADSIPEGETANVAMELARVADNDHIVCSNTTKKILDNYIEFEPTPIKSRHVNIQDLYLLKGERQVEAFGFLRTNRVSHELIGRKAELSQLLEIVNGYHHKQNSSLSATHAHIQGEAGIGKSRLVFELRHRSPKMEQLVVQCLPEYKHSGLFPILKLIKYQYSLNSISPEDAVSKLQHIIKKFNLTDEAQALSLLCAWLELPLPIGLISLVKTPNSKKEIIFSLLIQLIIHHQDNAGEKKPRKLLIIEDTHWADPTTLEFISKLINNTQYNTVSPILITTSRDPLPASCETSLSRCINLSKLTHQNTIEFIKILFDQQEISSQVIDIVASRTDGIPLFIEELVNMLKQNFLVQRLNGIVVFTDTEKLKEIPTSLLESLQQKLANLNYGKETAQLAAAIGREFDYALLASASNQSGEQLQSDINELLLNDLIYIQRKIEGDSYIFKHALVRDSAYISMPSSYKKEVHQQIALAIENDPKKSASNEILAHHWATADNFEAAVNYGLQAANSALKRSSAQEALDIAHNIQQWLAKLSSEKHLETQLSLYSLLTSAYMETKGWASEEVLHYSEESLQLLKASKNNDELIPHLWWKILNGVVGGKRDGLINISRQMDDLLEEVTAINKSAIRCSQGFYQFAEGNRDACIKALQQSIDFYDKTADLSHQQVFGFDAGVFAKATLGRVYIDVNQKNSAMHYVAEAVKEARHYNNIPSIGIALMYYAIVHQHNRNKNEVNESSSELIAIAEKHNLPIFKYYGQMLYDWSISCTEKAEEVLEYLTGQGSMFALGQFQSFYADVFAENKEYSLAIKKIEQCIALNNNANEHYFTAQLLLKKAKFLLASGITNTEIINSCLDQALTIAKSQGVIYVIAQVEELKAHFSVEISHTA